MTTYQNIQNSKSFIPDSDWLQISTIDMHTGGEPLRVIVDGFPNLKGLQFLTTGGFVKTILII